jgi:dipeptidase
MTMKKLAFLLILALVSALGWLNAQDAMNCFSVMAGKDCTVDGSVLFAHNEDDYGKQLVNWFAVPRIPHAEGEEFILKGGGRTGQPAFTNRYVWLELPGMDFSDCYLNEFGVAIGSNSCSSREDQAEISDGGIGYNLRQLMAERAVTARDAVILAGRLIEQYGYTGSGRTYCIADPNEAWALAVVKGKHWVAERVPDDQVMILPNNYTIREVDLEDTDHFLACPDLIEYAIKRGWYDPNLDGAFNFRNAYAARNSVHHPGNVNRAWGAYYLFGTGLSIDADFPFSFKPNNKVDKQMLMKVLRSHYEGTVLDKSDGYKKGSPYKMNGSMICSSSSVVGFVAELRSWMPVDVGCVMWLAPQLPDMQPFLPVYAGVTAFPKEYCRQDYLHSLGDHYNPPADIHERDYSLAFWNFVRFSELMKAAYGENIGWVRSRNLKPERKMLKAQPALETKLLMLEQKSPEECRKMETVIYGKLAENALATTKKSIRRIERE